MRPSPTFEGYHPQDLASFGVWLRQVYIAHFSSFQILPRTPPQDDLDENRHSEVHAQDRPSQRRFPHLLNIRSDSEIFDLDSPVQ